MKKTISLLLALVLTLGVLAAASPAEAKSYPDVKPGDWFYNDVMLLTQYEVISGHYDGYFRPEDQVKRGEFIKMLAISCERLVTPSTPSKGIHWAEEFWNMLNEARVLEVTETDANDVQSSYPIIPLTAAALDAPINRYEMAYMINRVLYMVYYEDTMKLRDGNDSYANHIADYNTMLQGYQGSVEQVYSKGILVGYEDSSFRGDAILTRAQAATVIMRLLSSSRRQVQSYAVENERYVPDPSFTSFALQYREMTDAQRRQALFGDSNKTHFKSAADAGDRVVDVTVKTWDINSSGAKYTRTWTLQVHALVSKEIVAIFDEIYNDPEQFPIKALGGARYSDTMRHSWGCAIDINPNENYYINYNTGQTVGSFCWKNGSSPYCITPDSSVVRAFARYGWGWGGQGWSTAADYMHFSILPSGG